MMNLQKVNSLSRKNVTTGNKKQGIRQIALEAGVSTATVSRVINGSDTVSQTTRDRVTDILLQTGYRPNAAAKALATNRTRTIAAIVPTLRHSSFAIFLDAFEEALASKGYNLVIATHGFDPATEAKRCEEVLQLGAEAIVLSGSQHEPAVVNMIKTSDCPFLFISVHASNENVATFGYNNQALAEQAINYLAELGHQQIHVIQGPIVNNDRMADRVIGVKDAARKNKNINVTLFETELGAEGGSTVFGNWIADKQLPHACLCLADVLALGLLFEANRHNLKIPEQMSLMGFENLDWTPHCSPSLTTIDLPAEIMGREAAIALVEKLDNGIEPNNRMFKANIVERGSTRMRITNS